MQLDMYNFNRKLKIKGIALAPHSDNHQDNIYYSGEIDDVSVYMTYSTKDKKFTIYKDPEYKKPTSVIKIQDIDLFAYIFDCVCYDEEEIEAEIVEDEEVVLLENEEIKELENKE